MQVDTSRDYCQPLNKTKSNPPLDLNVTAIEDAFQPRFIEGNAAIHFVLSPSHRIPFIEHNEYFKENVINGIWRP